jgi:carboxylate-amine ligase
MTNAPSPEDLRAVFDAPRPLTVGLEEEVMLLDPGDLDLAPRAADVLAAAGGDGRFKLELPAAQVEIVTPPCAGVREAVGHLAAGRRDLAAAAGGLVRLAGAGTHPFASGRGVLNGGDRYAWTVGEYGEVARRQLVWALQVHVAVGSAAATLPVYNALRSYLPELAALAANAPFYEGRDTGLASVRPKLAEALPRQGLPPALPDWETYAEALAWGARSGRVPRPGVWWWELRPHPAFGTLEVRVCDAQTRSADTAGVAAVVHCLVAWLVGRRQAGEELPVAPTWRIAENRWSANRHGLDGTMADLVSGEPEPTRDRLRRLLDDLGPTAQRLGCLDALEQAAHLAKANGAQRQRAVAADAGLRGLVAWMADEFLARRDGDV